MILDKLLQFDPAASLANTIIVAGVDSANTLDMLNARDMGTSVNDGYRCEVVFTVGAAMVAAGGAASLIIQVQSSADNLTYAVLCQTDSGGIPKANLTAGQQIRLMLSSYAANPVALLPRYLKVTYKAVTNPFTGGTFECDLIINSQASNPATYAAGVIVSN